MPDLLFEVFSEEIPARMQAQAAEDLKKLVTQALVDRGLPYEGAASFATPRRLALHIAGLPARQPDLREEKKGPRTEVAGPQEVSVDQWEKIFVTLVANQQIVVGVDLWEQAEIEEAAKNDAFSKWIEKNQ